MSLHTAAFKKKPSVRSSLFYRSDKRGRFTDSTFEINSAMNFDELSSRLKKGPYINLRYALGGRGGRGVGPRDINRPCFRKGVTNGERGPNVAYFS